MVGDIEIISGVTEKILTHELGAGSPCLKCKENCPGLDLHFWRKICRNCKCKQEDHDVQTSVSTRGFDNIGRLLNQDRSENFKPNVNKQVDDKKSHPVIDKSPSVPQPPAPEKAPLPQPPAPEKAPLPQPPAPEKAPIQQPPAPEKAPLPQPLAPEKTLSIPQPPVLDKSHSISEPIAPETTASIPTVPVPDKTSSDFPLTAPKPYKTTETSLSSDNKSKQTFKSDVSVDVKQDDKSLEEWPAPPEPSPLEVISSQPDPNINSQMADLKVSSVDVEPNLEQTTGSLSSSSTSSLCSSSDHENDFEWTPEISDPELLQKYMDSLPKDKRPVTGTVGAQYRKKQLMRQLPSHDQNPAECHDLTEAEKSEMDLFVKQYREKALGVAKVEALQTAQKCSGCDSELSVGDVVVVADRAGKNHVWEPACFTCSKCDEILVNLIYFFKESKLYCGRHYCEMMKPRCTACDELIFAQEYTQAEDCFWHLKHFCCWQCDEPLGGKNYVPHNSQPVCVPCYENQFAHTCLTCKEKIAPNTEWVTFEDYHWHASNSCFKCSQCSTSLVGQKCIPKGETVFCSSKCKKAYLST